MLFTNTTASDILKLRYKDEKYLCVRGIFRNFATEMLTKTNYNEKNVLSS